MAITLSQLISEFGEEELQDLQEEYNSFVVKYISRFCKDTNFKPNTCYIGRASDIPEQVNCKCCFICFYDDEYIKHRKNIILLIVQKQSLSDENVSDLVKALSTIVKKHTSIEERKLELVEACLSKDDFAHFMDIANLIFSNPLFLCDTLGSLIYFSSAIFVDEPMCNEVLNDKAISHSMYKSALDRNLFEGLSKNNECFLYHGIYCTRWFYGIKENGHVIAYLILNSVFHEFTYEDEILFKYFGKLVELNGINNSKKMSFSDYKDYSFLYLLQGNKVNSDAIQIISKKFKKSEKDAFMLAILSFQNQEILFSVNHYLRRELENAIENSITTIYNDKVILLFVCPITSQINSFKDKLKSITDEYNLHCGISRMFLSLDEIHIYYMQAMKALSIGERMDPNVRIYAYCEVSFFDLIDTAFQKNNWKAFCDEKLLFLQQFDKKHNSNYLSTLECYIKNEKSQKDTCNEMFIHRNSLSYRLKKIKELTGWDLNDHSINFNLYLSLHIIKYLK